MVWWLNIASMSSIVMHVKQCGLKHANSKSICFTIDQFSTTTAPENDASLILGFCTFLSQFKANQRFAKFSKSTLNFVLEHFQLSGKLNILHFRNCWMNHGRMLLWQCQVCDCNFSTVAIELLQKSHRQRSQMPTDIAIKIYQNHNIPINHMKHLMNVHYLV